MVQTMIPPATNDYTTLSTFDYSDYSDFLDYRLSTIATMPLRSGSSRVGRLFYAKIHQKFSENPQKVRAAAGVGAVALLVERSRGAVGVSSYYKETTQTG